MTVSEYYLREKNHTGETCPQGKKTRDQPKGFRPKPKEGVTKLSVSAESRKEPKGNRKIWKKPKEVIWLFRPKKASKCCQNSAKRDWKKAISAKIVHFCRNALSAEMPNFSAFDWTLVHVLTLKSTLLPSAFMPGRTMVMRRGPLKPSTLVSYRIPESSCRCPDRSWFEGDEYSGYWISEIKLNLRCWILLFNRDCFVL